MSEHIAQNVLIVAGDARTNRQLLEVLAGRGIRGCLARSLRQAQERLPAEEWRLVVAELDLDDQKHLAFLRSLRDTAPDLPVVLVSEDASVPTVVAAMREGCRDFLTKPLDRAALEALLEALLPNHDVPLAAADRADARCLYRIAGRSRCLAETVRLARRVAPTTVPVLIGGESGTGKELLSYLVHRQSNRARGPYIRVNCAALSESLLESELFGHERGAFTGAVARRKGKFELAHGGTLLLDEISETGPRLQAELLRVLEQQDFERVGGSESVRVDVRVISTTNRDLAAEVRRGNFRGDLYYRIKGVELKMPPLRERPEDIPVLVWHFVNLYAREVRRRITRLDPDMLERFRRWSWPGNVRQLRNVVRAALILGDGETLSLPEGFEAEQAPPLPETSRGCTLSLRELERQAIFEALRRTESHHAKAARLLGITDRTLREKLRRYRREGHLPQTLEVGESRWAAETA